MAQPRGADVGLRQAQPLAAGDGDLLGDQIDAGDRLGDRMLHLDTGVHLQEIERVALHVDQELHRPGAAIGQSLREADRGLVQALSRRTRDNPGAGVSSMSF